MSDQWKNRIVIVTTGILLFSFSIACLLKPSDEVSLSERRPLTQFPSPDTAACSPEALCKNLINMRSSSFRCEKHSATCIQLFLLDLLGKSDIEGLVLKR